MITRQAGPGRGSRRIARELTLRALYEWQVAGGDLAALQVHMEEEEESARLMAEANTAFFQELLAGVLRTTDALHAALGPHLDRAVTELSPVEHAALLIGAYELLHTPNVPYKVVINEAVNLAKKYGGTDGHKFVNGVLDKLARGVRGVEIEAAPRV
ncbi:MAG TPA: transcription antitermination factor NusB [Thiobacillaceae bacterium]|nr:transcription antitermination factor NusB [Thiobacillaceae bacterium]HNU65078.1 transcription antitermination factor NusB [Thiobacillaceae bacterium]